MIFDVFLIDIYSGQGSIWSDSRYINVGHIIWDQQGRLGNTLNPSLTKVKTQNVFNIIEPKYILLDISNLSPKQDQADAW